MNVTSATYTDPLANTNTVNAYVGGAVTDTADAFGGIVSVSNEGLGQPTTIGVQGVFVMEE
jgi:hypothetical protein